MAVRRRILRIEEARYATALVVARDNMSGERSFPGSVEVLTEVPAAPTAVAFGWPERALFGPGAATQVACWAMA